MNNKRKNKYKKNTLKIKFNKTADNFYYSDKNNDIGL